MSDYNWLQPVSRLSNRQQRTRSKYTHESQSAATEYLEPRALLSASGLEVAQPPIDFGTTDVPQYAPWAEAALSMPFEDVPADEPSDDDAATADPDSETEGTSTRTEVTAEDEPEVPDEGDPEEVDEILTTMGPQPLTFTIEEYAGTNSTVGVVPSDNPDVNASVTFAIVSGNESGAFSIDAATGEVTVANSELLDFETTPRFLLTVERTDASDSNFSGPIEIAIDLTNVNEAPYLSDSTLAIVENSSDGTVVGDVFASDPDVGSAFQYSIIAGNAAGTFSINAYTGKVTVVNADLLNYEARTSFTLMVQVTDNGSPGLSGTAQLTIQVINVDDPLVVRFSPTNVKYRIGDGAVRFGTAAVVTDEDNPVPNFQGVVISATITEGRSNKDVLSVKDSGSKSKKIVTRGENVVYGKTVIGTVSGGRGDDPMLRITLNEFATTTSVEALMKALSFSTKDTSTTTRELDVQFWNPEGSLLSTSTRSIPIKKQKSDSGWAPGWGFF